MQATRALRVNRGVAAATAATYAALFSHVAGGGAMPHLLGLIVPWTLAVPVCVLLAGARLSLPRLSASVIASQALFHGLFMLGTPDPTGVTIGAHHAHVAVDVSMSAGSSLTMQGPAPDMLVAHAVAAATTVTLMRFGIRAVAALCFAVRAVRAWARRALQLLMPRTVRRSPASPSAAWQAPHARALRFLTACGRRGPPTALAR